jgi:hypothetical protein
LFAGLSAYPLFFRIFSIMSGQTEQQDSKFDVPTEVTSKVTPDENATPQSVPATKLCPYCDMTLDGQAVTCRYCGRDLYAENAARIVPGHVYIVPPDLGVDDTNGLRFVSATSEPGTLPVDDTAILLLSGADPAFVDVAIAHAMQGALVAGQSPEGCYDATAPAALRARGGTVGTPSELVQLLLARWPARTSSP